MWGNFRSWKYHSWYFSLILIVIAILGFSIKIHSHECDNPIWILGWYRQVSTNSSIICDPIGKHCRGSPHGTLDLDPVFIGDPDPKTTLPPHGLNLDPSCVLCCMTVPRDFSWDSVQQCNARSLRALWNSHDTTLNLIQGSRSSESSFSGRLESPIVKALSIPLDPVYHTGFDVIFKALYTGCSYYLKNHCTNSMLLVANSNTALLMLNLDIAMKDWIAHISENNKQTKNFTMSSVLDVGVDEVKWWSLKFLKKKEKQKQNQSNPAEWHKLK